MTRLMNACLLAAFLIAISVSGAAAAHVETFHDSFDNTFEDTICDVDLTIHETGVANGNIRTDRQGHLLFSSQVPITLLGPTPMATGSACRSTARTPRTSALLTIPMVGSP